MRAGMQFLNQEQCVEIHLAVLDILGRVGVNVFHDEALELLEQAGAGVDGKRVQISERLLQDALSSAPKQVPMYSRDGKEAMLLTKGNSYFGTGSDTQFTLDLENGERRLAVKQDVANAARITDALPNIDFVMSLGLVSDVPIKNASVHQFEAMVLNTTKPLIYTVADRRDTEDILAIAEAIAGGREALSERPFMILYAQPSTPLQHSAEALDKLLLCAERRVPVQCVSAGMLGGTTPVTLAGAVVTITAEVLSGLVIHQLKQPGAPFIMGGAVPQMDMQTTLCSYGAPELQTSCAAMAAMAQYYDLPIFTTAGCSDAQVFDQQAGMEAGYTILMQALAGSNLIHDLGYLGAGMTSSMEALALCNDMAGMAKHILKGMEITPETMALDVLEAVGPGGNFFAEEHTVTHFRDSLCTTALQNRHEYSLWQKQGEKDFYTRANESMRNILATHQVSSLPEDVIRKIRQIVQGRDDESTAAR